MLSHRINSSSVSSLTCIYESDNVTIRCLAQTIINDLQSQWNVGRVYRALLVSYHPMEMPHELGDKWKEGYVMLTLTTAHKAFDSPINTVYCYTAKINTAINCKPRSCNCIRPISQEFFSYHCSCTEHIPQCTSHTRKQSILTMYTLPQLDKPYFKHDNVFLLPSTGGCLSKEILYIQ